MFHELFLEFVLMSHLQIEEEKMFKTAVICYLRKCMHWWNMINLNSATFMV